jgi:hypothetical protein
MSDINQSIINSLMPSIHYATHPAVGGFHETHLLSTFAEDCISHSSLVTCISLFDMLKAETRQYMLMASITTPQQLSPHLVGVGCRCNYRLMAWWWATRERGSTAQGSLKVV